MITGQLGPFPSGITSPAARFWNCGRSSSLLGELM